MPKLSVGPRMREIKVGMYYQLVVSEVELEQAAEKSTGGMWNWKQSSCNMVLYMV